jgi:hypothetical protein
MTISALNPTTPQSTINLKKYIQNKGLKRSVPGRIKPKAPTAASGKPIRENNSKNS